MRTRIAAPGNGNKARAAITPLEGRFVHAHLSPNRRALIKAILDNHEEAYFLSSRELAKRYTVTPARRSAIQDPVQR